MQFFFIPDTCALALHVALREANFDIELKQVLKPATGGCHRLKDNNSEYLAITQNNKVPAIGFHGAIHTKTQAILQYIAWDLAPDRLPIPQTGPGRWLAVETLYFIVTKLHKGVAPLFSPNIARKNREFWIRELGNAFTVLQGYLMDGERPKKFLLGDTFTVLDCYAWTVLNWTRFFEDVDLSPWPRLVDHRQRILQRPAVQKAFKEEALNL